jgi:hygromycin-B 4-O-kinase
MDLSIARPATVESVGVFLRSQIGVDTTDVIALVSGGWSNAFAYRDGGRAWVIRFSALEEDFRKDERVVRHASSDLPIPQIVKVGPVGDGFYAISERLSGDVLETIEGPRFRRLLPSLMGTLDAMRLADVSDSTGYGGWGADGVGGYSSWRAMLLDAASDRPSQRTHGWRPKLAASPTGDGPFLEAHGVLTSLAGDLPEARHLIHSDFMNRNVLVEDDRVSAVFDWGCAMYGDFLFDLAWIDFWAPWSPAWKGIDIVEAAIRHFDAIGLDVPQFADRLRACQIYIGLDSQGYQAFKGLWSDLEQTAARTLDVAGLSPQR